MSEVKAYSPVVTDGGWEIAIAVWGEHGFYPSGRFYKTEKEAQTFCDEMNEHIGINDKQAYMIVAKTMFPGCKYTLEDVVNAGRKSKTHQWFITWDDGLEDVIESEEKPCEEDIESGVDADLNRWGHQIKTIKELII